MNENEIKIIENKDLTNLECGKCQYGYDGHFSGRVNAEDIFIDEGKLYIEIPCEGCHYSKVLICNILENIDYKGNVNIFDLIKYRENKKPK